MRTVPHGIVTTKRFHPTSRDSAAAVGNAGVEAVATIAMILWIEATCGELMAPYLEPGEAGVGTRVAVDHTGPVFAGRPVEVHARVIGVEGRRIAFAVHLEQDAREVMTGEHVRAAVDLARFLGGRGHGAGRVAGSLAAAAADRPADRQTGAPERAPAGPRAHAAADLPKEPRKDPPPDRPAGTTAPSPAAPRDRPPVTFFFDVHSPWSYLASTLIGPLARRHRVPILWRPIHLANLMDRIGGMRPLDQNPARVAWYRQDLADRMAQHGLAYDPHPDYPLRPSRALRACVYAAERGCADAFVRAVMRGYWSEKRDISDLAVLQAMADEVGLGPLPVADIVADERYKAAVVENTDDAIASGVFGVPSFILEGKLFFGGDRMDQLDAALGRRTG
ncbi:MAG: DsbA family protein [Chromatiales bacterium]|nr:DsbA family protein [Chromatiales bacterium]